MKSIVAGLLVIGTSSAAFSVTPTASATPALHTRCHGHAVGQPDSDRPIKVRVRVRDPKDEDRATKGWLTIAVERRDGGDSATRRFWTSDASDGLTFKIGRLEPGRYVGTVFYEATPAGSDLRDCVDGYEFRVSRQLQVQSSCLSGSPALATVEAAARSR